MDTYLLFFIRFTIVSTQPSLRRSSEMYSCIPIQIRIPILETRSITSEKAGWGSETSNVYSYSGHQVWGSRYTKFHCMKLQFGSLHFHSTRSTTIFSAYTYVPVKSDTCFRFPIQKSYKVQVFRQYHVVLRAMRVNVLVCQQQWHSVYRRDSRYHCRVVHIKLHRYTIFHTICLYIEVTRSECLLQGCRVHRRVRRYHCRVARIKLRGHTKFHTIWLYIHFVWCQSHSHLWKSISVA